MDLNVNVNVKLDATPALTGVVSVLAGALRPAGVQQPAIPVSSSRVTTYAPEPVQEATQEVTTAQEQQAEQVSSDAPQEQPAQNEKAGEISDEMLRQFVGPKSKDKGKEAIFKILDEFGVKRVPDLKQEQRQAFIDKVNAL